ncbi:MAG: LysM peptidoglycan-binding domain-containing protein, partial [Pseudanabaena sp. CRU_2_10]|nr:LysM peptidoglycan-binding domain-containing protein [Pseudanabaena sp. CRU_2_10]
MRQRLEVVEGKEVLVSHSAPAIDKQSEFTLYKVKHGDTIEAIARRHGTSQSLIAQHNKLGNLHWLELGRELKIPAGKDTSTMQTVAYNSQKPLKHAFSTPSSLKANPATDKLEPVKSLPGKTEVLAIKVNAATPMILPGTTAKAKSSLVSTQAPTQNLQPQAALPSAWDGLMQLSGSDFAKTMPSQPLLEEVATQNSTAATTSLPVETEPGVKVATALFPFSSDRLLEQNAVGANVAKVIPSTQPAQEPSAAKPSIVLPKLAVALTMQSIQSFDILEQSIDRNHLKQTPSANSANSLVVQPAAEPSVQLSKLAVAPTIQSFDIVEQTLAKQKPEESTPTQPATESSVKLPKIAVAPSTPSVGIVEQSIAARNLPAEPATTQPAVEPTVKLPKLDVTALTISPTSSRAIEQQNVAKGKPTELALLPES